MQHPPKAEAAGQLSRVSTIHSVAAPLPFDVWRCSRRETGPSLNKLRKIPVRDFLLLKAYCLTLLADRAIEDARLISHSPLTVFPEPSLVFQFSSTSSAFLFRDLLLSWRAQALPPYIAHLISYVPRLWPYSFALTTIRKYPTRFNQIQYAPTFLPKSYVPPVPETSVPTTPLPSSAGYPADPTLSLPKPLLTVDLLNQLSSNHVLQFPSSLDPPPPLHVRALPSHTTNLCPSVTEYKHLFRHKAW